MLPLMACWYQQLLSASCSILSCHQAPRPHQQQKYFVAAVRAFVKRSIYGQWLQPQYYVDVVVSWLLKMVGFSRTSSTSPSTVCGVVDLVTRLTLHASKACISFLNVWYLFSGWLFVLLEAWKWFHIVVQCKLAMNLCSSWSGNNHSVSSVRQTTCLSCMV